MLIIFNSVKKLTFLTALIVFTFHLTAQEKLDLEMIYRIKKEATQNSQIANLSSMLTDYCGPRLSGSTNLRRARQWSMEVFKEWELNNIKEEAHGEFGRGWDIEKSYLAMTQPYYQTLIATPKAWTDGTDSMVRAEVILLDVNDESDFDKYRGQLRGKVVTTPSGLTYTTKFEAEAKRHEAEDLQNLSMYPLGRPESRYTPEQIANYRKRRELNKKISDFFMEEGVQLRLTGTRGGFGTAFHTTAGSYSADAEKMLPELELSLEHHGRIERLLKAGKSVEIEAEVRTRFLTDDLNGYNVFAEIPGKDKNLKDELVILGAHLDSWHAGTGANDNAAGVVVMMEVIRILKSLNIEPRRTIRIALWGEEEQGLHGSRNYVKKYVKDPNSGVEGPEFNKISAYYNLDNGSGKIRGIYTQGNDMVKSIFKDWFAPFDELDANTISNRNTGSTDHVAFDNVKVPGFQFIQDPIDYGRGYHTNMDVYERMMLDDMKQAAIIIASLVYHTAMRDEKLPRKP
jgi:carboxypeptidase Q